MNITYGNCTYSLTAKKITINRNEDTGNTLTLTYETPEEQALSTLPATGSETSILAGVILDKIDISYGDAGIATITLSYVTDITSREDYDENEGVIVEQTLEGSVTDEPILTHSNLEDLDDDTMSYLKSLVDGMSEWDYVVVLDSDGKPQEENGKPKEKTLRELLNAKGSGIKTILGLVRKGVQSYRSPSATWTEKRIIKGLLTGSANSTLSKPTIDVSDVGKISNPQDAPTPSGRNWLLVGKTLSNNSDGTWTQSSVWEMSGPDGWDENLYEG